MGLNIASYPGFELSGLPLQNVIQLSYFAAQVSSLPIIAVRFKMFNFFLFCLVIIVNIALNISIVIWKHICYCLKVFFFIFISFSENQLNKHLTAFLIYDLLKKWFVVFSEMSSVNGKCFCLWPAHGSLFQNFCHPIFFSYFEPWYLVLCIFEDLTSKR